MTSFVPAAITEALAGNAARCKRHRYVPLRRPLQNGFNNRRYGSVWRAFYSASIQSAGAHDWPIWRSGTGGHAVLSWMTVVSCRVPPAPESGFRVRMRQNAPQIQRNRPHFY